MQAAAGQRVGGIMAGSALRLSVVHLSHLHIGFSFPVSDDSDSDSAASDIESEREEEEAEPDKAGSGKKRRRKESNIPEFLSMAEALVTKLAPMMKDGKSSDAILAQLEADSRERREEAERKRKRREEDCPEGKPVDQSWDGKSLEDDNLDKINPGLRVKLRGPFGDPNMWWKQEFCQEKVEPTLGSAIYLRHIMGSDRPNNKAIAKSHSAFSIMEIKHFSVNNAGVTKALDTDMSMQQDVESGEQFIATRVRWVDVNSMWELVDAVLTRMQVSQLVRPWDYQWAAGYRAFHRARMFAEVSKSEKQQVELSKVRVLFYCGWN